MQGSCTTKIKKGFVNGYRLNQRCQREHLVAYLMANGDVMTHPGTDNNRIGAFFDRFPCRHGRMDAGFARDIASRRHDAAFASADNNRPVTQFRIITLFDRRIKGITIYMGDVQIEHFGVASYVTRMACRACCGRDIITDKTGLPTCAAQNSER